MYQRIAISLLPAVVFICAGITLSLTGPVHAVAPDNFVVQFELSLPAPNTFVHFNVSRKWAPMGVDRFYKLLTLPEGSYYNNNSFFRVVPNFVVQFGINGVPAVSQKWENANIQDDPVVLSNLAGTLCFATSGPNTRTTQLYVNYADNSKLDAQGFAPFAKLSSATDLQILANINAQYGQQPDQGLIYSQGDSYLQTSFPLLTYLVQTKVIPVAFFV